MADLSDRYGAQVIEMKKPAGQTFSYAELKQALITHKPAAIFLCQGESSTGTHQSLAGTLLAVANLAAAALDACAGADCRASAPTRALHMH